MNRSFLTEEQKIKIELKQKFKINNEITRDNVLIISEQEKISCRKIEALQKAEEMKVDLVEFNCNDTTSFCKLIRFEDFIYQKLKEKKNKKNVSEHKIIKLKANIESNDLNRKLKQIDEFLQKKYTVEIQVRPVKRTIVNGRLAPRKTLQEQCQIIVEKIQIFGYEINMNKDKKSFGISYQKK